MHSISKFLKKLQPALTLPPAYMSALVVILDKRAATTGRGTSALKAALSKPPCALHHSSHSHHALKFHLTNRYTGAQPCTWTSLTSGDACLQSGLNPFLWWSTSDNLCLQPDLVDAPNGLACCPRPRLIPTVPYGICQSHEGIWIWI